MRCSACSKLASEHSTHDSPPAATVQSLVADLGGLRAMLAARGIRVADYEAWQRVDTEERRRGELAGKPREKFCATQDMLNAGEQPR